MNPSFDVRNAFPSNKLAEHFHSITRKSLDDSLVACLGHGPHSPTRPLLKLIEYRGRRAVVKDFRDGGSLAQGIYGAWMVRREISAYRRLVGVEGIPQFLGRIDSHAIMIEHIEGEAFRGVTGLSLGGEYFEALRKVVRSMHERGVVHLDLHQRKNFMIRSDLRPFVIDFGSAFVFRRFRALNPLFRLGHALDKRALRKLERKYRRNGRPT